MIERLTATTEAGRLGDRPSLDSALAALSECAARIQALVPDVQAAVDLRAWAIAPGLKEPPRIIYGGGSSALGSVERRASAGAPARVADPSEPESGSTKSRRRSASDLFVAAELALAGRSRDEIAAYLQARRGPAAGRVIAEAFEPPGD